MPQKQMLFPGDTLEPNDDVIGDSGTSPMDYDAELRLLNDVLRRAYGIERHDQVLDIGCGAGQTTRESARMAAEGGALGVDLSVEAIGRARELAQAAGVRNATFVHADAQVHPFPSERFDLAISRFGTMFFLDPRCRVRQHRAGAAARRPTGDDGLAGTRAERMVPRDRGSPGTLERRASLGGTRSLLTGRSGEG